MVVQKLKHALLHILPPADLEQLVRGYDVIGDVAIIFVPPELGQYERDIASAILAVHGKIRAVAKRDGNYRGEFRTIGLKKIGGQGELVTVHREYGINLHVDLDCVYFSPRSGGERYRLACCVQPGEHVLVMFSGIAPLPLMMSKYSDAETIVGIEKNPVSHLLAKKNLEINKKLHNISLNQGDVRQVGPRLLQKFNRIAMPLPLSAAEFLDVALTLLQEKGWLHFYDIQKKENFQRTRDVITRKCRDAGRQIILMDTHRCGHVSPGKYRICVDAKVA